jgi:hypothetical protein
MRIRTQTVTNFLKNIGARCREQFIPGQNLSVDESVVGYKGRISFIACNTLTPMRTHKTMRGICVLVLTGSVFSSVSTLISYRGRITTEIWIKRDLPFISETFLRLFNNIRETGLDVTGCQIFTDCWYIRHTLASKLQVKCLHSGTLITGKMLLLS